jgi:hypothetical protein
MGKTISHYVKSISRLVKTFKKIKKTIYCLMNIPIFIAGCITLLAFIAHTFVGINETLQISPSKFTNKENVPNFETVERNWVQAMCAFQMITVDLLVLSILLFLIATTNFIGFKKEIAFALSIFYFIWGIAWILQLFILKRKTKDFLFLSQWAFWFICSILIYWGAKSL